ncbi:MAG: hypothetical protein M9897_07545 [Brumimicrobium sp.]|nr:hypothetical protein [Brumimicrobium sp.]
MIEEKDTLEKETIEKLNYLSTKSKELLDRQISTYRTHHFKAGIVISILSIFTPLFISNTKVENCILNYLIICSLISVLLSIILMVKILKSEKLDQGFNPNQLDSLVNKDFKDIILFEIGAKRESFVANAKKVSKQNKIFNIGLNLAVLGIILSIVSIIISKMI